MPAECEAELRLGKPLLEVRSQNTGRLAQLYNSGTAVKSGVPDYCIVRFDVNDRCEDLEFVAGGVSTRNISPQEH